MLTWFFWLLSKPKRIKFQSTWKDYVVFIYLDNPSILQVTSMNREVLDILHARTLKCGTHVESHNEKINDVKGDLCPPCVQSGTRNILQATNMDRGIFDIHLIMLEHWYLAHMFGIKYQGSFIMSKWPLCSLSSVLNHQHKTGWQCGKESSW